MVIFYLDSGSNLASQWLGRSKGGERQGRCHVHWRKGHVTTDDSPIGGVREEREKEAARPRMNLQHNAKGIREHRLTLRPALETLSHHQGNSAVYSVLRRWACGRAPAIRVASRRWRGTGAARPPPAAHGPPHPGAASHPSLHLTQETRRAEGQGRLIKPGLILKGYSLSCTCGDGCKVLWSVSVAVGEVQHATGEQQ